MSGKHRGWHKLWKRDHEGNLLHESGLKMRVAYLSGIPRATLDKDSVHDFMVHESARGVPQHDLQSRLRRLIDEAQKWRDA